MRRRIDSIALPGAGREPLAVVVHSTGSGPSVAVTANIHGDEVTGIAAVHALDELFPNLLVKGTVVLYPSLNPRGLARQQRAQPDEGVDLNRIFPGERDGNPAARHASLLWQDLLERKLDALVDLHADSAVSVPYAIVDRATHLRGEARDRMDAALLAMADAAGITVLHEYPEDQYVKFRLDRSLAGAMVNHAGVPAITLEVGPRRAVDPRAVRITVAAVLRIMRHLGMVEQVPGEALPRIDGGPWRRIAAPRVRYAGVFEPVLAPGDRFAEGTVLGTVRAVEGTVREVLHATAAGVVVSWTEAAWIEPRGVPGTLAVAEGPDGGRP